MVNNSCDVWISTSDDLAGWRDPKPVLLRRASGWWDAVRVGIGPPPLETPHGWLQIYHGVRTTMSGAIYRVSAAMLDLEEPWVVTHRLPEWILSPEMAYERVGDRRQCCVPRRTRAARRSDRPLLRRRRFGDSLASAPLQPLIDMVLEHPVTPPVHPE